MSNYCDCHLSDKCEWCRITEQNKRYREALEFLNEVASQDSRTSIGTDSHFVIEVTSQALEESDA